MYNFIKMKPCLTLYGLSSEYVTERYSLEDCLAVANQLGCEAIEMVASQMIPEYPYPSQEWMDYFTGLLDKYNLEPFCYSAYVDIGIRSDRDLSEEEIILSTLNDLIIAKEMGFKIVRTQHAISPNIFEKMAVYAKNLDIILTIEMHAPHNPEVPIWQEYLEIMDKYPGVLGVVPDCGIFAERPHPLVLQQYEEEFGCRKGKLEYIVSIHAEAESSQHFLSIMETEDLNEGERQFVEEIAKDYHPVRLDWLDVLIPRTPYIHGKFWYLDDIGEDKTIPYNKIFQKLKKLDYEGYIATEYEGHHFTDKLSAKEQMQRFLRIMNNSLNGSNNI